MKRVMRACKNTTTHIVNSERTERRQRENRHKKSIILMDGAGRMQDPGEEGIMGDDGA